MVKICKHCGKENKDFFKFCVYCGNEFPKYEITPLNPMNFTDVDKSIIDKPVANRFSLKRSNEDISAFLTSGEFPERKPYIPKEEYKKLKEEQKVNNENVESNSGNTAVQQNTSTSQSDNTFDPFADSIITKPRKV